MKVLYKSKVKNARVNLHEINMSNFVLVQNIRLSRPFLTFDCNFYAEKLQFRAVLWSICGFLPLFCIILLLLTRTNVRAWRIVNFLRCSEIPMFGCGILIYPGFLMNVRVFCASKTVRKRVECMNNHDFVLLYI